MIANELSFLRDKHRITLARVVRTKVLIPRARGQGVCLQTGADFSIWPHFAEIFIVLIHEQTKLAFAPSPQLPLAPIVMIIADKQNYCMKGFVKPGPYSAIMQHNISVTSVHDLVLI